MRPDQMKRRLFVAAATVSAAGSCRRSPPSPTESTETNPLAIASLRFFRDNPCGAIVFQAGSEWHVIAEKQIIVDTKRKSKIAA